MSSGERSKSVNLDADGYFFAALKRPLPTPDELSRLISVGGNHVREILLVQFLFRSSLLVYNEATQDTMEIVNHLSRRYLLIALKHFDSLIADPPLPFELTHRPEEIRARLRAANPRVDDFAVKASIEPRFFAWTNLDTRQITISWVTREVLFKFNMLLWNRIFKTTDMLASSSSQPWNFHEDIRELAFAFMPYLALEYRQLDYMAVPFPRAYDERVLHNAVRSTTDQLYFLLSHEFAHAALHSDTEITAVRRSIEEEADALALNLTLRRDQGSPSDTFISITWLFQYLALSRLAGALLNDHPDPVAFAKEVSSRSRMPSLNCLAEAGDVKEIDRQSASLGSRYLWEISNALVDLKKMTGERFAEFLSLDKMKLPDAPEFHLRVLRSAEAVFQWTAKNAK